MKKVLFLLAATLLFASCTEKDENYENSRRVAKGFNIYGWATVQQNVATTPVDMALRLAVLLAEAEKQGDIDLSDVQALRQMEYDRMNLWDWYFGRGEAMTLTIEADGYTMTFAPQTVASYGCKGRMKVVTGGRALLSETDAANPWRIELASGFQILIASRGTATGYNTIPVTAGDYTICREGNATYSISMSRFSGYFDEGMEAPVRSDWSGRLTLTAPDKGEGLAYSDCADKMFGCNGSAEGDTFFTFDRKVPINISYRLENGLFADGLSIYRGEEHCVMNTQHDFYPVNEVEVLWDYADGGRRSRVVRYNGFSWQTKI